MTRLRLSALPALALLLVPVVASEHPIRLDQRSLQVDASGLSVEQRQQEAARFHLFLVGTLAVVGPGADHERVGLAEAGGDAEVAVAIGDERFRLPARVSGVGVDEAGLWTFSLKATGPLPSSDTRPVASLATVEATLRLLDPADREPGVAAVEGRATIDRCPLCLGPRPVVDVYDFVASGTGTFA